MKSFDIFWINMTYADDIDQKQGIPHNACCQHEQKNICVHIITLIVYESSTYIAVFDVYCKIAFFSARHFYDLMALTERKFSSYVCLKAVFLHKLWFPSFLWFPHINIGKPTPFPDTYTPDPHITVASVTYTLNVFINLWGDMKTTNSFSFVFILNVEMYLYIQVIKIP